MPSSFPHFPPAVVHDCRCDWVRQLMLRSAWLHSTLRELPPACFGALLLHLPACWQRLAFMVESQQEVGCQVMWAVQCRPAEFAAKFPEFAKWRTYGEQAAAVRVSGGTGMRAGARVWGWDQHNLLSWLHCFRNSCKCAWWMDCMFRFVEWRGGRVIVGTTTF